MQIRLGLKQEDLDAFVRDLCTLNLTGKQKKKILTWTLGAIKRKSQKNIREQHSPDGTAWEKRKPVDGEIKNKRLLKKVLRYASILAEERGKGRIYYKNPLTGEIAQKQQDGFTEHFRVFATDKNKNGSGNDRATIRQAQKLRSLGYRKRNGKNRQGKTKYRLYTIKEIRERLTRTWASMEIRRLENKVNAGNGKTNWEIHVPARPFLDTREKENVDILREITLKFLSGEYK